MRKQAGLYRDSRVAADAQLAFFAVVRTLCPEPLFSLREDVFPAYRGWADGVKAPKHSAIYRTYALIAVAAPDLASLLQNWARQSNLEGVVRDEPEGEVAYLGSLWPVQFAIETLWAWWSWPGGKDMRNASPPEWVKISGRDPSGCRRLMPTVPIMFMITDWDERTESEVEFVKRTLAAAKDAVDHHLRIRRAEIPGLGLRLRRNKREPAHLKWLVEFQIGGRTWAEIAQRHQQNTGITLSEDAIRSGIESAADEIGLKLRAGRRGPHRT
jgi:hypothetical protein